MNPAAQAIYHEVMRELWREGEAARLIAGNEYRFLYTDFGTEITRDGAFLCEITQNWELEELLCGIVPESV